jgi:chemotaxis protein MotB
MGRKRKKPVEEETRHAAWAIPYGDLVTLLFAFFVVLYAVSSVNEGKYRALSSTLFTEFNGQKPPGSAPGSAPGQLLAAHAYPVSLTHSSAPSSAPDSSHAIFADTAVVTRKEAEEIARSQAESQALDKVADDVSSAMSDLIKSNLVVVRRKGTTIEVEIRTDILFPSGSATLSPTAVGVIRQLSQTLVSLPNPVRVEGHTDSQPIDTPAFPSNWELSSARAASVVHVIANSGIDPARLSVIGRAQYSPSQPNTTAAGRNANRRVLIAILPPGNPDPGATPSAPAQGDPTAPVAQPAGGATAATLPFAH